MRSFEFVEGTSAKYWEIWREGQEVTVRFGRVGAAGQTKVKNFEDPGLAQAHEAKLIAEKTRKGYVEITSPTAAAAVPAPSLTPAAKVAEPAAAAPAPCIDEDTFIFPPAWHRHRYPRRGSAGLTAFTPDPKARTVVDEEIRRVPNQVNVVLEAPGTAPDVRTAGLAWRAGDPGAGPVGAAAVALAAGLGKWSDQQRLASFVDVWVAERGLLFAVEAAVEVMAMRATEDGGRSANGRRFCIKPMLPGDSRHGWQIDHQLLILFRARHALATASDDDYAAALAMLTEHRTPSLYRRVATSVLAPAQAAWVEQDIAGTIAADDHYLATALLAAARTGEQAAALAPLVNSWTVVNSLTLPATLADGLGAACAPALFHWFDEDRGAEGQRRLLSVLAALPGDEVLTGLIERIDAKYVIPAVLEAAERYPARAMRLLAEAGAKRAVADLLRGHVIAHPGLVEAVLPTLSADAAARVSAVAGAAASVVVAPAEAVPPILVTPPWANRARPAKPVVVPGLTCADPATLEWLPGERERWRETCFRRYGNPEEGWAKLALRIASGRASWHEPIQFFTDAPEAIARPLLARWRPDHIWDAGMWMRVIIARFEMDALPLALAVAEKSPSEGATELLPFSSPAIAIHMADWLSRLKSLREPAQMWLLRHSSSAARALVPPALGKAGVGRRQAERALLVLHGNGHTEAVRAAGRSYGADAAAAIETLLATDPLDVLPARIPANPAWAAPALLPPLELRAGAGALPAGAVANVVTMLALSRSDDPYAGLATVREACEPESLAEFGWQLFQRWQASGANAKENWVLDVLSLIGDDETVRRLTPLILAWPGEGGHARAVTGVGVLAAIGSDVALMHLHGIAQRAKFKGLKTTAQQKMDEVAAGLGLSAEQLADRLVPDFGLDAEGSLRLDYGPRQFVVGFDEQLRPYVADTAGKHLKALPKPGAKDDDERATAAYKQFAALKKDVRTVAADQIRRLERAMVTGRRWPGAEFRQLFVDHPLLWHIVRRLVWGVYAADGTVTAAIRVAEDRSFATVDDDETTLADDAVVGVAHPLQLGSSLAAWSEVFADYQILQPFPQLSRPTFALTPAESETSELSRFVGLALPTTKVLGLERRGWRREEPQDGGVQGHIELKLGPKLEMAIALEPGIVVGMVTEFPEQKLTDVFLHDGNGAGWRPSGSRIPLGRLDPVAASEIIRDLTEISA
jgi:predicted DNA-binding WGR domain protein